MNLPGQPSDDGPETSGEPECDTCVGLGAYHFCRECGTEINRQICDRNGGICGACNGG